jgi:hypothetical protein
VPFKNPDKRREYNKLYNLTNSKLISTQKKDYYLNNREEILSRHSLRNAKRKALVINHYGKVCNCCSEYRIEFLCIDHVYGGGNEHRKEVGSGTPMYKWLLKNNYPDGFRVLCHNCNMSLGAYGYCPHKSEGT